MHVAVRHIEGYQGVPSSDLDEGSDVHEREAVIGEEALGPAGDDACLGVGKSGVAEVVDAVLVEGFEVGVIMLRIGGGRMDSCFSAFWSMYSPSKERATTSMWDQK